MKQMAGNSHVPILKPYSCHIPASLSQTPPTTTLQMHFQTSQIWSSMETGLAESDLILTTTASAAAAESEKAWHVLALLLSLGRTARPAELASRCALFRAAPDFVESLCSVPGSLLLLTGDFHVTLSPLALTALAEFVSNSNLRSAFNPRIGNRFWNDIDFLKVYSRKRRPSSSLISELAPVPKRRAISDSEAGNEDIVLFSF